MNNVVQHQHHHLFSYQNEFETRKKDQEDAYQLLNVQAYASLAYPNVLHKPRHSKARTTLIRWKNLKEVFWTGDFKSMLFDPYITLVILRIVPWIGVSRNFQSINFKKSFWHSDSFEFYPCDLRCRGSHKASATRSLILSRWSQLYASHSYLTVFVRGGQVLGPNWRLCHPSKPMPRKRLQLRRFWSQSSVRLLIK